MSEPNLRRLERQSEGAHGEPGCTCVTDPEAFGFGENPECPHHGYEAVIARLTDQLAGAVKALDEVDALLSEALDTWTWPKGAVFVQVKDWIGRVSAAVNQGRGEGER